MAISTITKRKTTDHVNHGITDRYNRPNVVEGDDTSDLTIYFETEATLQTYVDIVVEHPEQDLSATLNNPTDDYAG